MQTQYQRNSIEQAPSQSRDGHADRRPSSLRGSIPGSVAAFLAFAWVVAIGWLFSVTPAADPNAQISGLDLVLSTAMFYSWFVVLAGVGARRRFAIAATIVGGALLAIGGVQCGLSGHTGMWIAIQIGIGIGLVGLGVLADRLT